MNQWAEYLNDGRVLSASDVSDPTGRVTKADVYEPVTETWHQPKVEPFDDAEFYEPGPVVTVTGSRTITVYSEERYWCFITASGDTTKRLCTAEQFRSEFPDGELPEDSTGVGGYTPGTGEASLGEGIEGWAIRNNGWFDLYSGNDNDGEQGHLDAVTYSLNEAIADARRIAEETA